MIYELVVTDKCNRKCPFCQISKGQYFVSESEADIFCDNVLSDADNDITVSFYGGETLLNLKSIEYCIERLSQREDIQFFLVTNGDFIDQLYDKEYLTRLNVQITAYDIFADCKKYLEMLKKISHVSLTYTFTEDDIDRMEEYQNICENVLKCNYRFVYSHSKSSWEKIDEQTLYYTIREITKSQLRKIGNGFIPKSIEPKYKRTMEYMSKNGKTSSLTCISDGYKKTFYNGRFLAVPCIMFKDMVSTDGIPNNCKLCKYSNVCNKSCRYEWVNSEVTKKLCLIEKAQFDELFEYFNIQSM